MCFAEMFRFPFCTLAVKRTIVSLLKSEETSPCSVPVIGRKKEVKDKGHSDHDAGCSSSSNTLHQVVHLANTAVHKITVWARGVFLLERCQ